MLLLGERQEPELPWCVEHDLTVCVNEPHTIRQLARAAAAAGKRVPVHLKIHTGMSRYGVRWDEALPLLELIAAQKSLRLEGAMTHFAQSDEADKSFALLQISRFDEVMSAWRRAGAARADASTFATAAAFWICRSAHRDMVRVGILLLRRFSLHRLPAHSGHPAGHVGQGAHRRHPASQSRRSGGLRHALHRARAAPHRRAAHRLRRRLPARAQRRAAR